MIADLERMHTVLFSCWRRAEEICNILSEGLISEEDVKVSIARYMPK